jgi:LysM repeat protein
LSLNQKNNDSDSVNLSVNEMMERPESVINESTEKSNTINQTYSNYKVKAGDTLNAIARNNRTTVAEIKKINKLDSDVIRINQILKLPK